MGRKKDVLAYYKENPMHKRARNTSTYEANGNQIKFNQIIRKPQIIPSNHQIIAHSQEYVLYTFYNLKLIDVSERIVQIVCNYC